MRVAFLKMRWLWNTGYLGFPSRASLQEWEKTFDTAIRREVCDSETVAENPVPQKSQSELLDKISFSQCSWASNMKWLSHIKQSRSSALQLLTWPHLTQKWTSSMQMLCNLPVPPCNTPSWLGRKDKLSFVTLTRENSLSSSAYSSVRTPWDALSITEVIDPKVSPCPITW